MFLQLNLNKQKCFNNEFDNILKKKLLNISLEESNPLEKNGSAKSSVHISNFLLDIPNFPNFIKSKIVPSIISFPYNKSIKYNNIHLQRCWVNEIFEGCSGKIHAHSKASLVAVFYYKVPKNSSDLVLIESFKEGLDNISDYPINQKKYLNVKEGDLVVHEGTLHHGVSEHKSKDSRICFIFDFLFRNL